MPAIKRFEARDRVELTSSSGRTIYGTVTDVGEAGVTVVADGARQKLRVPGHRLDFSTRAVRRDLPCAMDAWQVVDFEEGAGTESAMFAATVTRHGVPVLRASNAGYGAPDRYLPLEGGYAAVEDLSASVEEWLKGNGADPEDFVEPMNFWLLWRARQAPYGVLAAEAVEHFLAEDRARPSVGDTLEDEAGTEMDSVESFTNGMNPC